MSVEAATDRFEERESYHSDEAISRGDIVLFNRSRREYRAVKDGMLDYPADLDPPSKLDALNKGTATHTLLLEPWDADSIVVWDGGTRSGKTWDKFQAKNRRKTILTVKQFIEVLVMASAAEHVVGSILRRPTCEFEKRHDWVETVGGIEIPMRALLDCQIILGGEAAVILDVKTTEHATKSEFRKTVKKYLLWLQVAHYTEAVHRAYGIPHEAVSFHFVCLGKSVAAQVSKACLRLFDVCETIEEIRAEIHKRVKGVAPLICRLHRLPWHQSQKALEYRSAKLLQIAECMSSGDWSDPGEAEIQEIDDVVP